MWPPIAPLFDDAAGNLGEEVRPVIELRLRESKSLSEIGAPLGPGRQQRSGQDAHDPGSGEAAEDFQQKRSDADADAHRGRGLGELGVSRTGGFGGDGLGQGRERNFDFGNSNNTGRRNYEDHDLVEA